MELLVFYDLTYFCLLVPAKSFFYAFWSKNPIAKPIAPYAILKSNWLDYKMRPTNSIILVHYFSWEFSNPPYLILNYYYSVQSIMELLRWANLFDRIIRQMIVCVLCAGLHKEFSFHKLLWLALAAAGSLNSRLHGWDFYMPYWGRTNCKCDVLIAGSKRIHLYWGSSSSMLCRIIIAICGRLHTRARQMYTAAIWRITRKNKGISIRRLSAYTANKQ
jgi:hypothetical protein